MIQDYASQNDPIVGAETTEKLPYEAPAVVVRSFTRKSHRINGNCTHFNEDVEYR
jgi:hypothetical protein